MFDAYEVAIVLKLKDQFSGAMGIVTRHLIESNKHATELEKRLTGIGTLFKAGVMTGAAGFGIAMALKASTNEAVRFEQQMNRLKALNVDNRFGSGTQASLVMQAQQISNNTKGTSQTEALKLVTEAQAITGDPVHTKELVPMLAKIRFGMETYMAGGGHGGGHGAGAEKQFMDIVKLMEMRGLMRNFTPEKMESMGDLFVKNYVASGGMVKPSDFLAMMKTGGTAAKGVDDDFMFALGHIMQEKGGSRSGTALMSTYQGMVAGRMPQQVAGALEKLGLLDHKAVHYGKTGHITHVDAGGMVDSKLMQARPDLYLQKYILPALQKQGVDMNDTNAVLMKLNALTGQRTSSDFFAQMFLERSQIQNYIEQAKGSKGVNALYKSGEESTAGQQEDLAAKVNTLELEFGRAALPILKTALEQVIPLVKQFGDWLHDNPEGLKTLVTSIAALGVAFLVASPIMMIGSGLGLLSTALTLVSPAMGSFAVAMAFKGVGGATGIASMAGSLGSVAGQLKLLGAAGLLFASFELGQIAGSYIQSKLSAEQKDRGGENIAKFLAFFGNSEAQESLRINQARKEARARENIAPGAVGSSEFKSMAELNGWGGESSLVKTKGQQNPDVQPIVLNVDGKKLASVLATHQANSLGSGNYGGLIDGNLQMTMPGIK